MNLVKYWMSKAAMNYGSISAGVRHLNRACQRGMQPTTVYGMKDGRIAVNQCLQRHMMSDVFYIALIEAGFEPHKIPTKDFEELCQKLSLPARVK